MKTHTEDPLLLCTCTQTQSTPVANINHHPTIFTDFTDFGAVDLSIYLDFNSVLS